MECACSVTARTRSKKTALCWEADTQQNNALKWTERRLPGLSTQLTFPEYPTCSLWSGRSGKENHPNLQTGCIYTFEKSAVRFSVPTQNLNNSLSDHSQVSVKVKAIKPQNKTPGNNPTLSPFQSPSLRRGPRLGILAFISSFAVPKPARQELAGTPSNLLDSLWICII